MPRIINTTLLKDSLDGPRKVDMGLTQTCIMFVIPRKDIADVNDIAMLHQHCFYILLGKDADGGRKAYIGHAYDFMSRVKDHQAKKDFWDTALVFVSETDKIYETEVGFLEYLGITKALKVGNYNLDENKQVPKKKGISSSQENAMENFFHDIMFLTRFYNDCCLFEEESPKSHPKKAPEDSYHDFNFVLSKKGIKARIRYFEQSQRYVLLAGSTIIAENGISLRPAFAKLRAELFASSKAIRKGDVYEIIKDYEMPVTSPSSAAVICAATSRNGATDLTDDSGKTFKDIYSK